MAVTYDDIMKQRTLENPLTQYEQQNKAKADAAAQEKWSKDNAPVEPAPTPVAAAADKPAAPPEAPPLTPSGPKANSWAQGGDWSKFTPEHKQNFSTVAKVGATVPYQASPQPVQVFKNAPPPEEDSFFGGNFNA
jgi:hypothetical protein